MADNDKMDETIREDTADQSPAPEDTAGENAGPSAQTDEEAAREAAAEETAEAEAGEAEAAAEEPCEEAEEASAGAAEAGTAEKAKDAEEAGAEAPAEEKSGKKDGKGFFGRRKEKKDKKDQQIEELTDRQRRLMAEFDNFRKRTEKEKASMFEVGARSVIEKLLPVVDSFERGLNAAGENPEDPFAEGMQKIYKQLVTTLEEMGVKPIEAVGQPFDPEFHNAVMHVEDENLGENVVAEEFQKGYIYRETVIRHSMVKVAN